MKNKNKKTIIFISSLFLLIIVLVCVFIYLKNRKPEIALDSTPFRDDKGRLIVITSLFPVYDFARIVGGDKAVVSLILPPDSEAHSFKPLPKDLDLIKKSALFFYTSKLMESWAPDLAKEVSLKTKIFPVADGLDNNSGDPHVWLDFDKASQMVDRITADYQILDPANAVYYQNNAGVYKNKLKELDNKFLSGLKDCKFSEFISGGHFTFAYLAKRYNLKYQSVQGVVPDDSHDTDRLITLGKELKMSGQLYVYYEELIMPTLAEVLHRMSGAKLMSLNAAHNVGKYDISSGATFINLMENDLSVLQKGLECRTE